VVAHPSVVPLAPTLTALTACEARYIEVIERDETAGWVQYADGFGGIATGPASNMLSKGGIFEIFDTTDKKRIVSVRFLVHEPPLPSFDPGQDLNRERLYRAADEAFGKLLTAARKH
jgi:hypothetical protein